MDWKETAGRRFFELLSVMETLRGSTGCPWDKEQTLKSLKAYLLEETYEVLEAMDDKKAHLEELGDLLLQIVFQSEIRREAGDFDAGDVAGAITEKLKRRHPHIFGSESAENSAAVKVRWEEIKAAERRNSGKKSGILAGIPKALPQLLRAYRIGERAARQSFDWPDLEGVWAKVAEETAELKEAIAENDKKHIEHEFGDLIMALVNLGRHLGVNPEEALRLANERFIARFSYVEEAVEKEGGKMNETPLNHLEELWQEAKKSGC